VSGDVIDARRRAPTFFDKVKVLVLIVRLWSFHRARPFIRVPHLRVG